MDTLQCTMTLNDHTDAVTSLICWDQYLLSSSSDQAILKWTMPMLDQFHPCIHDSIENIVDVKTDGNCGYRAIVGLLGM